MRVSLIKNGAIRSINLPLNINGSYWLTDVDQDLKEINFINIIEDNKQWKLISNLDNRIIDGNKQILNAVLLKPYSFYYIQTKSGEIVMIYSSPINEEYLTLINNNKDVAIGRSASNKIIYDIPMISERHAVIVKENNSFRLVDLKSQFGVYVNNTRVYDKILKNGDMVFIMGLKIMVLNDLLFLNNPFKRVTYDLNSFKQKIDESDLFIEEETEDDELIELYKEDDYFFRSPRFKTLIEKEIMVIDPPPSKEKIEDVPIMFVIGPMLTMSMMSLMTVYTALDSYFAGTRDFKSIAPSLVIGFAMMTSMILWPTLNRRYQKRQKIKSEEARQQKYSKYIDTKREMLETIAKKQRQILTENYIPLNACESIILNKTRQLWERKIDQVDFLSIRLGIGTAPLEIDIRYPEEHFAMEEDNLKSELNRLVNTSKDLYDVPIPFSFTNKHISGLVGPGKDTQDFLKKIIFQLTTFHSYEDLKLVFLVDEKTKDEFEYIKNSPHIWSDEKTTRFFATNYEEMKEISMELENDFQFRLESENSDQKDYKSFAPYYLIITNNYKLTKNLKIMKDLLKIKRNFGFGLIVLDENLSALPNECQSFISIKGKSGGIFESELISTKQKEFIIDDYPLNRIDECFKIMANIPIKFSKESYALPKTYTFLEMFNVGKVEQLNALYRWQSSNPISTLQVPIGVDSSGMPFNLDIHEKAHGPHGLIAGMTGSGKSELILSLILSLAVNYHPDDVAIVLIDYKGGFLAGALKNEESDVKLPHIAGTITNLDSIEMKRSLVSIESELKRRQILFNQAREKLNESTMDIYKYQKYYHEGLIDEPIPHLLIISDEFAELKTQQSEFMDQLISTARIGRSLGIHLILATQKPSGIVNDQIWSNSRFKICLKVQEKADSMDVIKKPDAANLKQVGRFYLQVGYDEFFALGQSAWSGAQYIPKDKYKKEIDKSIDFIDNVGKIYKEVDFVKMNLKSAKGEQLQHVVKYLSDISKQEGIEVKQLWLDSIPENIYLDDIKQKYNYKKENPLLNVVIGEYDNPSNQFQGLLTLPLSKEGNTIIYGSSNSGKEMLLNTILYSAIETYTPEELNFYIMDFGLESLRVFSSAPHVGDIVYFAESEKINNLFKMIRKEIDRRRKMFIDYNASFEYYLKTSGKKEPTFVIIINNYEAFQETYQQYEEDLLQLTREGLQYGIIFILTVSSATSIRYKLQKNFKQNITLQLNDEDDYYTIHGSGRGLFPSKFVGRGLVKIGDVFEFQTANLSREANVSEFIKEYCDKINENQVTKAPKIPILPEQVYIEHVIKHFKGLEQVPLGIEKNSLETSTYNFKRDLATIISAQNINDLSRFSNSMLTIIQNYSSIETIVLDLEQTLQSVNNDVYYTKNADEGFGYLYEKIYNIYNVYATSSYDKNIIKDKINSVIIISGIDKFKNRLSQENVVKLDSLFGYAKELELFNFIFIDSIDNFKKVEYDAWFKNSIKNSSGIWVGNGITEQFTLKISKITRDLYNEIDKSYGYVLLNGTPRLVKFIEGEDEYER